MATFVKMAIGPVSKLVNVEDTVKINRLTNKGFAPVLNEDGTAVIITSDELNASNIRKNAQINNSDVLSLISKSVAAKNAPAKASAPVKAAEAATEESVTPEIRPITSSVVPNYGKKK